MSVQRQAAQIGQFRVWPAARAVAAGWPADRRKRKRAHRHAARDCIRGGTFLNPRAPLGSTPWWVAQWHLYQARHL